MSSSILSHLDPCERLETAQAHRVMPDTALYGPRSGLGYSPVISGRRNQGRNLLRKGPPRRQVRMN